MDECATKPNSYRNWMMLKVDEYILIPIYITYKHTIY